jgi:hypothetical protein
MIAEASSTIRFKLTTGCLASFGNELINQRHAGFYVLPDAALRPRYAVFHGRDPQLVIIESQEHFIPRMDAQGLTE